MDLGIGLVLGAMYFGTRVDEATSFALLDRYVEAGGRRAATPRTAYAFWTSTAAATAGRARRSSAAGWRPTPACATSW